MEKEKLYLVCKSKAYYGNMLAYNVETSEYVCLHCYEEVWREKGDKELFDYMNECRKNNKPCDSDKLMSFPVYVKYVQLD